MTTQSAQKTTYKVSDFLSWQKIGSLLLSPAFQRRPMWPIGAKSLLIDTVVRDIPTPMIFLREVRNLRSLEPQRQVVDGQQRLRTLISFIDCKLLKDFDEARDSGRPYADWLPFDRTEKRAEMFFRAGRPFTNLDIPKKDTLRKAHLIRNAIAHANRSSIQRFEEDVIGVTPVPPRERYPAGFLRGLLIAAPPQTRYEDYVAPLVNIARDITR